MNYLITIFFYFYCFQTLGQELCYFDFKGNNCTTPALNPTRKMEGIYCSSPRVIGAICATGANVMNTKGWSTKGFDSSKYIELQLVPQRFCSNWEVTHFTFSYRFSSISTQPRFCVRSNLSAFNSDIVQIQPVSTSYISVSIPLNYSERDTLKIRIYAFGLASSSSSFRIDNVTFLGNYNPIPKSAYFQDRDGDGFGNPDSTVVSCTIPLGFVKNALDCNDGLYDTLIDSNQFIRSYFDEDKDGYGFEATLACKIPNGFVLKNGDCDDLDASVHPMAVDIPANGKDEDCSGADTPPPIVPLFSFDFTGNTCSEPKLENSISDARFSCTSIRMKGVKCSTISNAFSTSNWVNGTSDYSLIWEVNGQNCNIVKLNKLMLENRVSTSGGKASIELYLLQNGASQLLKRWPIIEPGISQLDSVVFDPPLQLADNGATFELRIVGMTSKTATYRVDNLLSVGSFRQKVLTKWYKDADGDGFGSEIESLLSCDKEVLGYLKDSSDCNDFDATINPNSQWFLDSDNDGLGNESISLKTCDSIDGYVRNSADCDDFQVGLPKYRFYFDADNDGFGDATQMDFRCFEEKNWVENDLDCNDLDINTFPNAPDEMGDGIDSNCDGMDGVNSLFVENLDETVEILIQQLGETLLLYGTPKGIVIASLVVLDDMGKQVIYLDNTQKDSEIKVLTGFLPRGLYHFNVKVNKMNKHIVWLKN